MQALVVRPEQAAHTLARAAATAATAAAVLAAAAALEVIPATAATAVRTPAATLAALLGREVAAAAAAQQQSTTAVVVVVVLVFGGKESTATLALLITTAVAAVRSMVCRLFTSTRRQTLCAPEGRAAVIPTPAAATAVGLVRCESFGALVVLAARRLSLQRMWDHELCLTSLESGQPRNNSKRAVRTFGPSRQTRRQSVRPRLEPTIARLSRSARQLARGNTRRAFLLTRQHPRPEISQLLGRLLR